MDDSAAARALRMFLRIACQDIAEQMAGRTFKSTFGLVLGGSLRLAIGPVNYLLPVAEAVSWLAQVGVRTYVYMTNQQVFGGSFEVLKDGDDVLVEANRPDRLTGLPIELPATLQLPWTDLFHLNHSLSEDRTLARTAFKCGHCGRRILHGRGGHSPDCPLHDAARIDPAVFVTRRTLPSGQAAPTASGVSSHTCQDCGRRIDRVDDFEMGHAACCRVNGFRYLSEWTATSRPPQGKTPSFPHGRPPGTTAWQCPTCERIIQLLGELEVGHADWCAQRPATWLLGSGVTIPSVASAPGREPRTRCRACGHTVVNLRGHELGHGANCPHNPEVRPS